MRQAARPRHVGLTARGHAARSQRARSTFEPAASRPALLTAVVLTAVVLAAAQQSVNASDVKIQAQSNSGIQFSDNYFLDTRSNGWTGAAFTTGVIDALFETRNFRLAGTGNFTYRKFFGPGVSRFSDTDTLDHGAGLRFEHFGPIPNDRQYLNFTYSSQNASLAQLEEIGIATARGDVKTYSLQGGLDHPLTALDTLQFNGGATRVIFDGGGPSATPSTSLQAGGTLRHQVSRLTSAFVSAQGNLISYDNERDVLLLRNTVGVETQLTDRLSFTGQIGGQTVKTFQDRAAPLFPSVFDPFSPDPFEFPPGGLTATFARGNSWTTGLTGEARLGYQLKTGEISVYGGESVSPGTLGELSRRRWLGTTIRYDVNSHENLSAGLDLVQTSSPTHTIGGDAEVDFITVRASYNRQLAREWQMALTYTYQERTLSGGAALITSVTNGTARSNSIILSVSRDFTAVP